MKHDNDKDCIRQCEHTGKDKEFICKNGVSCKKVWEQKQRTKIRKETAENILNDLYFNLESSVANKLVRTNDYYNVLGWLEQLAEEYGVKIHKET